LLEFYGCRNWRLPRAIALAASTNAESLELVPRRFHASLVANVAVGPTDVVRALYRLGDSAGKKKAASFDTAGSEAAGQPAAIAAKLRS
jgi:hypothetical protein